MRRRAALIGQPFACHLQELLLLFFLGTAPELSASLSPNWSSRDGLAAGPSLSGLLLRPVMVLTSNLSRLSVREWFHALYNAPKKS